MTAKLRITILVGLLIGALFMGPQSRFGLQRTAQQALDLFDRRPRLSVLMVGNSRTYYHDMPIMVRRIADSTYSPKLYDVSMLAWGGATFEQNWNDANVRHALQHPWSLVVLQGESRASLSPENRFSFDAYGRDLIFAAKRAGSPVAIIVNWGYGAPIFDHAPSTEFAQARYVDALQVDHGRLAGDTGADLINTGEVWRRVQSAAPSLVLYEDGNHPSVAGSYLSALMIYAFISGRSVADVTFRPSGVDEKDAVVLRDSVDRFFGRLSVSPR